MENQPPPNPASYVGEWLKGTGQEADIVISSRIRLARNLQDFPFPTKASPKERTSVSRLVQDALEETSALPSPLYLEVDQIPPVERLFLVERHLISMDHASGKEPRAVAYEKRESLSIMINEEDHLRLQALRSGLAFEEAWQEINALDSRLEGRLHYAFSGQYGYLTSCPTNAGTGLRASVMLHLPALVMTKQIDKVFQAVSRINLAVRGLYGEGTKASGDFYQISNQVTLGKSEEELLEHLKSVVPQIIRYERSIRETLASENRLSLEDRIWRAYAMLRAARTLTSEEALDLLSALRLGVNLKIIPGLEIGTVNRIFILVQPAHLQKMEGRELTSEERDTARARYVREQLGPIA